MALIQCPECGKQISDKSSICIHCGCPLDILPTSPVNKSYCIALPSLPSGSRLRLIALRLIRNLFDCEMSEINTLLDQVPPVIGTNYNWSHEQAESIQTQFYNEGIPTQIVSSSTPLDMIDTLIACPECGSTEYHANARGYSIITGFLGSGKTVLTCLKCGHRWKPWSTGPYG